MKKFISLLIVLSFLCVITGCSDRNSKDKSDNMENSIDDTIPGTDTDDNNVDFFFTPSLPPGQNITLTPEPASTGISASEPTMTEIPKPEDLSIEEVFTDGTELEEPVIKTAAVAYADYGRILSDCLNMGKMAISSVQHLPIFKFDTYSELEKFKEKYYDDLCPDEGRDEVVSFNESTKECDESFFENNSLIAVYVPATSGSYRFSYRDISIRDGRFYMNVYQINEPEVYTDDMSAWMVLAEYPKPDIESCTEYDAAMVASPFSEILFEQFLDIMPASLRGVFLFRRPFTLAWSLREESGTDSFNVISYAPFGKDKEKADWEEYTVMDLDDDGSYEAVIYMMDKSRTRECYLVLSEIDGKAYGYEIPFRGMNPLRADGRIYGSSASDQNTIYRFKKFRTDGYETEALAQRLGSEYEVAGSKANVSEYASYFNEFEKVDTASWYGLWDIPAIDIIENSQTTESIPAEDDSLKMWNAYADIAGAYYSAQKEFKNTGILPGNGLNSLYFAPNGTRMEQISKEDFLVYDVNDDGTPEFFISRYYDDEKKDVIYDAYTWNGVMAVRFLKDEEIGYRSGTCDIRENGIILSFYSGSAWDSGFEVLTLPAHANSVMRLEKVYAVRAGTQGNYYSEYYRMIEGSDSPEQITEEDYRKYCDSVKIPELEFVENVPEEVERLRSGINMNGK
ncbi:MAG: hypothetical protein K6E85_07950 [Lachnospiraceae bacterium]|nr:hypothetical protein [Lachnospiraceae bacterium]